MFVDRLSRNGVELADVGGVPMDCLLRTGLRFIGTVSGYEVVILSLMMSVPSRDRTEQCVYT
jgi:hypothetical protein